MSNRTTIQDIRRVVDWSEDDECPGVSTSKFSWTEGLRRKIYAYVKIHLKETEIIRQINRRKKALSGYNEFKVETFEGLTVEDVVGDWDSTWCENFGYSDADTNVMLKTKLFLEFLLNKCMPLFKKTSVSDEEINSIYMNDLSSFLKVISNKSTCSSEEWVDYCDVITIGDNNKRDLVRFEPFAILVGEGYAYLPGKTSEGGEGFEKKVVDAINKLIAEFKSIEGHAGSDYNELFGYDPTKKKLYYPILTLISFIFKLHGSDPKSVRKEYEPDFLKNLADRFGLVDETWLEVAIEKYKKTILKLSKSGSSIDGDIDKEIRGKIIKKWLVVRDGFEDLFGDKDDKGEANESINEEIGGLPSVDPGPQNCDGTDESADVQDESKGSVSVLEVTLEALIQEIEEKLLYEDVRIKGADRPTGRGNMRVGSTSSNSRKNKKNVPEFCKIDWPKKKNSRTGIGGALFTTDKQINTWGWISTFMPSGASVSSGTRTAIKQVGIIIDEANKKGITVSADVKKLRSDNKGSVAKSSNKSIFTGPLTTELKSLCSTLRNKGFKVAFPSDHEPGFAIDISTTQVDRVENILMTLAVEISGLNITTEDEPTNGGGAVHITISSASSPDKNKIEAIWKKIEDCKK